jgi:predicted nucleotidyltransferase
MSVDRVLESFVEAARSCLGSDLRSIVLYGSAAEGRLRQTSDVNAIVILAAFDAAKVDQLREPLRTAHAAVDSRRCSSSRAKFPRPSAHSR